MNKNTANSNPQKMISGVPQANPRPSPICYLFQRYRLSTKGASIIKHADATVIYVAGLDIKEIDAKLSEFCAWFSENAEFLLGSVKMN